MPWRRRGPLAVRRAASAGHQRARRALRDTGRVGRSSWPEPRGLGGGDATGRSTGWRCGRPRDSIIRSALELRASTLSALAPPLGFAEGEAFSRFALPTRSCMIDGTTCRGLLGQGRGACPACAVDRGLAEAPRSATRPRRRRSAVPLRRAGALLRRRVNTAGRKRGRGNRAHDARAAGTGVTDPRHRDLCFKGKTSIVCRGTLDTLVQRCGVCLVSRAQFRAGQGVS